MEKLTKEEYKILYLIVRGRNSIDRLEGFFSKETILRIIEKLEKEGLIKISHRDNEIYGLMESSLGETLLNSEEYEDWFGECGD